MKISLCTSEVDYIKKIDRWREEERENRQEMHKFTSKKKTQTH